MSYRQCRILCQMLRSLNYTRIISLENFSKPNFELVAEILYWLAQKYNPQSNISDDINQQKDRIEFMKSIVNLFTVKARIKLNSKKLYQADSQAVAQLIKITSLLYKASNAKSTQQEEAQTFTLPLKVSYLKSHKALANQICDLGVRLSDFISKQPQLRTARNLALQFLQGMNDGNQSNDQAYIENSIRTIMQQQAQNTSQMTKYVENMENQQKNLQQKLKKKTAQLQRAQKRYKNLVTVKPAFMQQYQRLEEQLSKLHLIYVNKYRNLDYLQSQLEALNKLEQKKIRKDWIEMNKNRKIFYCQQIKDFKNENELNLEEEVLQPEQERSISRKKSRKNQQQDQQLQDQQDQDDDSEF